MLKCINGRMPGPEDLPPAASRRVELSAGQKDRDSGDGDFGMRHLEQTALEPLSGEERMLCVLFADVAGSTRLYERLGNAEALHAVERCIKRMRRATETFFGRVAKTIGDEVMAVFESPDNAVHAACEMQKRVDDLPPVSGVKLGIRIGFQYGPVIEEADDVFGDSVNVAARLTGLAKAGQIITSKATVAELSPTLRQATRELDAAAVKGKEEDVEICEVLWQETGEVTMMAPRSGTASPAVRKDEPRLRLHHNGVEILLDARRPVLTLGREANNDFVVLDRRASRQHARIERRRDKFVLVDQSTNGTYVTFDGELEFALKREEVVLRMGGQLSFGHSSEGDGEFIRFEVLK